MTVEKSPKGVESMKRRENRARLPQNCFGCGQLCERWVLHHIVPLEVGGQDIPTNLAILCHPCHARAHRLKKADGVEQWGYYVAEQGSAKDAAGILSEECHKADVSENSVIGPSRNQKLVQVRARIVHRLVYEMGLGPSVIARLMERDHSTILYYLDTRNPDGSKKA